MPLRFDKTVTNKLHFIANINKKQHYCVTSIFKTLTAKCFGTLHKHARSKGPTICLKRKESIVFFIVVKAKVNSEFCDTNK